MMGVQDRWSYTGAETGDTFESPQEEEDWNWKSRQLVVNDECSYLQLVCS